jgi:hypothetical protein
MRKLTVHQSGKYCNCLFCLTQCPNCGESFSLEFSASYDMARSEDMILLYGSIQSIHIEAGLSHPNLKAVCSKCGFELSEQHVAKIKRTLFSAIGGNVRIDKNYDRVIVTDRSEHKRAPTLGKIKRKRLK